MAKASFNVFKREVKKVKNIPTGVFTPTHEKITEAALKKVLAECLETKVNWLMVEDVATGVKTEYKKQPRDKNYTLKTLKK